MNYPNQRYTGPKPWMDKDWLYNEYVVLDKSTKQIALEYGCKQNTIQCWLLKHNIKKDVVKTPREIKFQWQDKDYLYDMHINKRIPMSEIASINNISQDTVKYYLDKYNIESWKTNEYTEISESEIENIKDMYVNKNMSANQISKMYGVEHKRIISILKNVGIETRGLSESQIIRNEYNGEIYNDYISKVYLGLTGNNIINNIKLSFIVEKNNWEKSNDKYEFFLGKLRYFCTIHLNPLVLKRDNCTCKRCNGNIINNKNILLHVHHIKPFLKIVKEILAEHPDYNCCRSYEEMMYLFNIIISDARFLDLNNLITYCNHCHSIIHYYAISENNNIVCPVLFM